MTDRTIDAITAAARGAQRVFGALLVGGLLAVGGGAVGATALSHSGATAAIAARTAASANVTPVAAVTVVTPHVAAHIANAAVRAAGPSPTSALGAGEYISLQALLVHVDATALPAGTVLLVFAGDPDGNLVPINPVCVADNTACTSRSRLEVEYPLAIETTGGVDIPIMTPYRLGTFQVEVVLHDGAHTEVVRTAFVVR